MMNKNISKQRTTYRNPAFSGIATYCAISGTLLTSTTQFAGTSAAGLFKAQLHPIFSLTGKELKHLIKDMVKREGSDTERFLVIAAVLYRAGTLICDVPLAASDKVTYKAWELLVSGALDGTVEYLLDRADSDRPIKLPIVRVSTENCDASILYFHLNLVLSEIATIQNTKALFGLSADDFTGKDKLDYELRLEYELKAMMKSRTATKFTPHAMRKALKELVANDFATPEQLHQLRKVLTADLDTLSVDEIKAAIQFSKDTMDLSSVLCRNESLACINQLEGKLRTKLEIAENLGFIVLAEERGAAFETVQYHTRTAVTDTVKVLVVATHDATGRKLSLKEQLALRAQTKAALAEQANKVEGKI